MTYTTTTLPWRTGTKVELNVYDGDGRPICQTHTVNDAKVMVNAVNRPTERAIRKQVLLEAAEICAGWDSVSFLTHIHLAAELRKRAEEAGKP